MNANDIAHALEIAGIQPSTVTAIEEVGDGWECRVFRVVRPGVDDVALRLYTADTAGGTLRAEVAAYLALQEVDYPAPRLLAQHVDTEPLGAPFVLIDWLEGPLMESLGPSFDTIDSLTALFARLHDIPPNEELTERYQVPVLTNEALLDGRRAYLADADLDGFLPALDWLAEQLPHIGPLRLSYVHMDFHQKNVILTSRGPVVFDWGSFAVADPRSDLAWTHLLAGAYLGESAADRLLATYRRIRPAGVDDFAFFDVSAIWRRFLIIVMMLRDNLPAGVREQVLEAIQRLEPAYRRLVDLTGTSIDEVESLYSSR